jgi:hypothetical protein
MSDPANSHPRRYVVDDDGHRVLVGLSLEETAEFERLEASIPAGGNGCPPLSSGQWRWLELYDKHDVAWLRWIADLQAGRDKDLPAFN